MHHAGVPRVERLAHLASRRGTKHLGPQPLMFAEKRDSSSGGMTRGGNGAFVRSLRDFWFPELAARFGERLLGLQVFQHDGADHAIGINEDVGWKIEDGMGLSGVSSARVAKHQKGRAVAAGVLRGINRCFAQVDAGHAQSARFQLRVCRLDRGTRRGKRGARNPRPSTRRVAPGTGKAEPDSRRRPPSRNRARPGRPKEPSMSMGATMPSRHGRWN